MLTEVTGDAVASHRGIWSPLEERPAWHGMILNVDTDRRGAALPPIAEPRRAIALSVALLAAAPPGLSLIGAPPAPAGGPVEILGLPPATRDNPGPPNPPAAHARGAAARHATNPGRAHLLV